MSEQRLSQLEQRLSALEAELMEIRQEMASLRKLQPVTTGPNLAKDAQQLRPAVKDRPKINAASSP